MLTEKRDTIGLFYFLSQCYQGGVGGNHTLVCVFWSANVTQVVCIGRVERKNGGCQMVIVLGIAVLYVLSFVFGLG